MTTGTFTILGSSAGMPQPARVNSGYVLAVDGRLTQFDCGGGVAAAFRWAGFDPLAVERIVVSHTHPDHISDLPLYIQMLYLAGRREAVTIHLPEEAVGAVRQYFRALYLLEEKLPFAVIFEPVTAGVVISGTEVRCEALANSHLHGYAELIKKHSLPHRMQCFSYRLTVGDKTLLYSADLGSENDLAPHLKDLDVLVIESTHIDVAVLLELAAANRVGRIILTHIAEDYDAGEALTQADAAAFDGLSIAHDGKTIDL